MAGKKYEISMVLKAKDLASAVMSRAGAVASRVGKTVRSAWGGLQKWAFGDAVNLATTAGFVRDVAVGLKDLATSASETGSRVKDLSVQTGLSTSAIQELGYAAGLAGVETSELDTGMRTLTKTLGAGVPKASAFNKILGKGAPQFVKNLKAAKGTSAQFEVVLAQMAAITDQGQRSKFATIFFGKAGTKLAGVVADGAEGLRKLRREARGSLGFMSDEDIDRADEFGDVLDKALGGWSGAKTQFGLGLIDAFLPALTNATGDLLKNGPAIRAFVRDIGKSIGTFIIDAGKLAIKIGGFIGDIVEGLGKIEGLGPAVGIALAAAFNPILAAVAGIGVVISGIAKLAAMNDQDRKVTMMGGVENMLGTESPIPWMRGMGDMLSAAGGLDQNFSQTEWWKGEKAQAQMDAERMRMDWITATAGSIGNVGAARRNGRVNTMRGGFLAADSVMRQYAASPFLSPDDVIADARAAGRNVGVVAAPPASIARDDQKIEVVVTVQDPKGLIATDVKASPGTRVKAPKTGQRSLSHMKGSGS